MGTAENVAALRACYARWTESEGADGSLWLPLLAEDFRLSSIARGRPEVPFTADCTCRAEAETYLAGLAHDWQMEWMKMDRFIAEGDTVVVTGNMSFLNRHTGKRIESPKVDIWTFRDGLAVAFEEFYDSCAMIEAARP